VEVLNDLDGELVNLYPVCQAHYEELICYLRFTLFEPGSGLRSSRKRHLHP